MVKLLLSIWLVAAPAAAMDNITFAQAKEMADRDEASLSGSQSQALIEAQGAVVGKALSSCVDGSDLQPPPFTVVVELDSTGAVVRAWRSDETRLAKCFEAIAEKAALNPPPRSPFYSSYAMDLSGKKDGK